MNLLAVGCNFEKTPVEVRERLAFDEKTVPRALDDLTSRYGCEAVILSTCNRVEIYLGWPIVPTLEVGPACRAGLIVPSPVRQMGPTSVQTSEEGLKCPFDPGLITEFLAEFHQFPIAQLQPLLYCHENAQAVRHLFRVAASLDSLIVGEGQISGQVRRAYEKAQQCSSVGPLFHALFQHANAVAGRVRTETGISRGHISVSSVAVDYVRQVFDHFDDKTILVIGAGKMGELTLPHLRALGPRRILVTNRNSEKAEEVARECQGECVAWDRLDDSLAQADLVLSTTAAPEPIVSLERYELIRKHRSAGLVVILDIAVPRDFDPRIHDGEQTCLFNIDDLKRIREETLRDRLKHVGPAEAIVEQEARRFLTDWERRRNGPLIARLTEDLEAKRRAIVQRVMEKLNGRLTPEDREYLEGAFRKLENQFLHGPISALTEETHEGGGHSLREAFRKLFRLED